MVFLTLLLFLTRLAVSEDCNFVSFGYLAYATDQCWGSQYGDDQESFQFACTDDGIYYQVWEESSVCEGEFSYETPANVIPLWANMTFRCGASDCPVAWTVYTLTDPMDDKCSEKEGWEHLVAAEGVCGGQDMVECDGDKLHTTEYFEYCLSVTREYSVGKGCHNIGGVYLELSELSCPASALTSIVCLFSLLFWLLA